MCAKMRPEASSHVPDNLKGNTGVMLQRGEDTKMILRRRQQIDVIKRRRFDPDEDEASASDNGEQVECAKEEDGEENDNEQLYCTTTVSSNYTGAAAMANFVGSSIKPDHDDAMVLAGVPFYRVGGDNLACSFYSKIGACRHGNQCSRRHIKVRESRTVLLAHMFADTSETLAVSSDPQPGLSAVTEKVYDTASRQIQEFYEEMFYQMSKYGEIEDVILVDNLAAHMTGNVYVKYFIKEAAARALENISGKFYCGRVIKAELSPCVEFRDARCSAFTEGTCPRGQNCNFLHPRHVARAIKRQCVLQMYADHPEYLAAREAAGKPIRWTACDTKKRKVDWAHDEQARREFTALWWKAFRERREKERQEASFDVTPANSFGKPRWGEPTTRRAADGKGGLMFFDRIRKAAESSRSLSRTTSNRNIVAQAECERAPSSYVRKKKKRALVAEQSPRSKRNARSIDGDKTGRHYTSRSGRHGSSERPTGREVDRLETSMRKNSATACRDTLPPPPGIDSKYIPSRSSSSTGQVGLLLPPLDSVNTTADTCSVPVTPLHEQQDAQEQGTETPTTTADGIPIAAKLMLPMAISTRAATRTHVHVVGYASAARTSTSTRNLSGPGVGGWTGTDLILVDYITGNPRNSLTASDMIGPPAAPVPSFSSATRRFDAPS
ncbi:unnamed protein product [Amoebophrya sp. A25]|nr:unnamed protein product [Amoebophrya sp. A25]|eukprot:GSA25T00000997001.1